ncbi:GNAT family N-acetyltransferase [Mucilaginibacter sp.]
MELNGTSFKLRIWALTDAPALQKHAGNPNIYNLLLDRFPKPYTLSDATAFIEMQLTQPQPPANFAIEVNGKAAGVIGIEFRGDVYSKTPLLGYWLGEAYWGRGIMAEAVKLITNYAFATFDIICIQANTLNINPKSMRVLEKAGYEKQAVLKQSVIKNDVVLDEHVYMAYKS